MDQNMDNNDDAKNVDFERTFAWVKNLAKDKYGSLGDLQKVQAVACSIKNMLKQIEPDEARRTVIATTLLADLINDGNGCCPMHLTTAMTAAAEGLCGMVAAQWNDEHPEGPQISVALDLERVRRGAKPNKPKIDNEADPPEVIAMGPPPMAKGSPWAWGGNDPEKPN